MKTILYVPFVSQYSAPRDEDGLSRACGMACVKKVVDFVYGESGTLIDYLTEGKMIKDAYIPGIGWTHKGLVAILRNHGVGAYNEEFKSVYKNIETGETLESPFEESHVERGIRKIAREVEHGRPVIVSGVKDWNAEYKNRNDKFHDTIILGVEINKNEILGFYYHDPDDENKDGKNQYLDINTFKECWRRFAIFVSL